MPLLSIFRVESCKDFFLKKCRIRAILLTGRAYHLHKKGIPEHRKKHDQPCDHKLEVRVCPCFYSRYKKRWTNFWTNQTIKSQKCWDFLKWLVRNNSVRIRMTEAPKTKPLTMPDYVSDAPQSPEVLRTDGGRGEGGRWRFQVKVNFSKQSFDGTRSEKRGFYARCDA